MTRLLSFTLLLIVAASACAGDKPGVKAGDQMIDQYLANRTKEVSGRFLDGAKTRDEWEKKLPRLRREYLDMLGLWPLPAKTPLDATVTGTLEHEGVVIEKLHYQSRPGLYVTANLYRPKTSPGKLPAILYVCGHSGRGRDGNKTAFQEHGLWFAANGYVCLIVDTLQLGELPGIHHGTYREGRWWWQALGYTPAGVECWNGIRGIDYLISRPDVDPQRIGVTGISGGGATTVWVAAADDRVKVAVPVSGMSDLESYVTNKVINGHCDCMFLVNTYGWEWTTIAALIAPRPLLFANSDSDRIFPMDGNRRIIAKLRQLYQMYAKPHLVDDYVSQGGHDYRPDLRVAVFRWINKHLKNDAGPVKDAAFKPLPGQDLRVFPTDKDLPGDALNGKIDETFVRRAEVKLPEAGHFGTWKKALLKELRAQSFRSFPERVPAGQETARVGEVLDRCVETEAGITAGWKAIVDQLPEGGFATLKLVPPDPHMDTTSGTFFRGEVVKGAVRGVLQPWTAPSPPNYVARAHALLGLTIDQGQVRDVAALIRYLNQKEVIGDRNWRVIGERQLGIIAAYAALFEPSIKEVVLIDPPTSHREGPIFLNVLRVLDIPEALGLLAPDVKLTIINGKAQAFDRTAQLYQLAAAGEKLERK